MRSQVMNQRVPQSNPDLVELEIANYLPKIGSYNHLYYHTNMGFSSQR